MTTLSSLAKAEALHHGRAQQLRMVRHIHISDRPFVIVPLTMAGEANAPLAAMVGGDRDNPTTLVVTRPRARSQRFHFATELAAAAMPYIRGFTVDTEIHSKKERFADAPQFVVPNTACIEYLAKFGRSTRLRLPSDEYPVDPRVSLMGRWLTFFAEEAEYPDSSMLLAATRILTTHLATGQSAVEDNQLASVIAWIEPWDGLTTQEALARASDPVQIPPAGPGTDITFDKETLAPTLTAIDKADGDPSLQAHLRRRLERALLNQMEPAWHMVWQAIDIMRRLPPARHTVERWNRDKAAFTRYMDYSDAGGFPQPRRDHAIAAAARLKTMEHRQAQFETQSASDDPLAMAELRLRGDAFTGIVTATQPLRLDPSNGRKKRPLVTLSSLDCPRLQVGDKVHHTMRPEQEAKVFRIEDTPNGTAITLEIQDKMGRGREPSPGSVPEVGDRLTYQKSLVFAWGKTLPEREDTPWTHGGPPVPYEANADDTDEEWS